METVAYFERRIREEWHNEALRVHNERYAEAILDGEIDVIPHVNEVVLSVDIGYDWKRFESGKEETDLKTILLYGPHSKSIRPKISKNGVIQDPGGRYNIIPMGGGVRLRTVSTPRFDGHGRLIGSDPTSWIIPARASEKLLDKVLKDLENEFQARILIEELADI